jgi:hypothetical protein
MLTTRPQDLPDLSDFASKINDWISIQRNENELKTQAYQKQLQQLLQAKNQLNTQANLHSQNITEIESEIQKKNYEVKEANIILEEFIGEESKRQGEKQTLLKRIQELETELIDRKKGTLLLKSFI